MADSNPYRALVAAEPDTTASDPQVNPYRALLRRDEADKDAAVAGAFDIARRTPYDLEAANEIARATKAPVDMVVKNLPAFRQAAEASAFDATRFRREHPELARLVAEDPNTAHYIERDEKVGLLTRMWRSYRAVQQAQEQIQPGMPRAEAERIAGEAVRAGDTRTTRYQESPELEAAGTAERFANTWTRTRKRSEIHSLGTRAILFDSQAAATMMDPADTERARARAAENHREIIRRQQELGLEPYFESGAVEQATLDVAETTASMVPTLKAGAAGAAGGALLGGGVGYLLGGATGAKEGALLGARLAAGGATLVASFDQEAGAAYLEFRDQLDEDGKPMDPAIARGAAITYGLMAAGVETAQLAWFAKAFGPLGAMVAAGKRAAFAKALMAHQGRREAARRVAGAWAANAGTETLEELVQETLQHVAGWAGSSASADEWQPFEGEQLVEKLTEVGTKTLVGSALGAGLVGAGVNATTRAIHAHASERSVQQVAAIVDVADSKMARGMPQQLATLVQRESDAAGAPVRALYLDPARVTELLDGADLDQAARDLMGDDGPRRMREAMDRRIDEPGYRATLEVPLVEFMERWGTRPLAQQLVEHATTRPGLFTAADQARVNEEDRAYVERRAQEIQAQHEQQGGIIPEGPAESALLEALEGQLQAASEGGAVTPEQVSEQMAVARASAEAMARRTGQTVDELLEQFTYTAARAEQGAAPAPEPAEEPAPAEQEAEGGTTFRVPAGEQPWGSRYLSEALRQRPLRERAEVDMWVDRNTGLYNARGFAALAPDPARPMVANVAIEGTKWKNKETHTAGNLLYRAAGQALAAAAPGSAAAKWGGDFVATVASQEEANQIAAAMQERLAETLRAANPELADQIQGLEVTARAAPRGEDLDASIKEASALNAEEKAAREQAGTRAPRGERPRGVPVEAPTELLLPTEGAALREVPGELAARAAAMGEEELFGAMYLDPATGLLSREGFFALPPKKHVISLDLNGLRKINEQYGNDLGDQFLAKFAAVAREAGASAMDMAHLSGDEYAAQTDDEVLAQEFVDILGWLCDNAVVETDDGRTLHGITFGYGIGQDYDSADSRVEGHKAQGTDAERAARRERFDRRRRGDLPQRGEALTGGGQPQAHVRIRSDQATHGRRARVSVSERARAAVRREVARLSDNPLPLSQALKRALKHQESSVLADNLATVEALKQHAKAMGKRLAPKKNHYTSKTAPIWWVWREVVHEYLGDEHPSEKQSAAYIRWVLSGKGERPGEYPGGLFKGLEDELHKADPKAKKEPPISSAAEAFHRLVKLYRTTRTGEPEWSAYAQAIETLRGVKGYGALQLPQKRIDFEADQRIAAEEAARFEEAAAETKTEADVNEAGELVDPDTGEILFQPAWHGTPHRGIERFSLEKIGTGEGAQAYGWGLYFAGKKEVAEYYRKNLGPNLDDPMTLAKHTLFHAGSREEARRFLVERINDEREYASSPVPYTREHAEKTIERLRTALALIPNVKAENMQGQLHRVDVPADEDLLDADKPLREQSARIQDAVAAARKEIGAFLTAGGKKTTGRSFYDRLSAYFMQNAHRTDLVGAARGDEAASVYLRRLGVPGLRYLDGTSRGRGDGSHNYVIWDEDAIAIKETLYQGPRGYTRITQQAIKKAFSIFVTDKADVSTTLHELAHTHLEMLIDLAARDDAPEQIKTDAQMALDYMGLADIAAYRELAVEKTRILVAAANRDLTTAEQARIEQLDEPKERWAKSFEAYVMEGKAPSRGLVETFQRLRVWLLDIYKHLKNLGVELNDDIRGVFDRLLATDEELAAMRTAMGAERLFFESIEVSGMTPAQYEMYSREWRDNQTRASLHLQREVARARNTVAESEVRRVVREARPLAEERWAARKDWRAWRYLRRGEVTTSDGRVVGLEVTEELRTLIEQAKKGGRRLTAEEQERVDLYARTGKLDKAKTRKASAGVLGGQTRLESKLRGRLIEGGEDPAEVAASIGFRDARDMLDAIATLPDQSQWLRQEAERIARLQHPELFVEATHLEEMARRALHEEGTSDSFIKEWQALLAKGGVRGMPPVASLVRAAQEMVRRTRAGHLAPGVEFAQERDHAEKAIAAAARGDFATAARHKEQQLLHHFRYRELDRAKHQRDQFKALAIKVKRKRDVFGKAGKEFLDGADQILEALGMKEAETKESVLSQRLDMLHVVQRLMAAEIEVGFDTAKLTAILMDPPGDWRSLSMDDLRLVHDALTQLYTAAREANTIILEGQRRDLAEVAAEIATDAEARKDLGAAPLDETRTPGWWTRRKLGLQHPKSRVQQLDAAFRDPLDTIRDLGPTATKVLWREGYLKARAAEDELTGLVTSKVVEMWERLPKALRARRYEALTDLRGVEMPPEVNRDGTPGRQWMWMVALNMGNESNMDRLLKGYQWDEAAVRGWLNRNMTPEEWRFVQDVWDLFDRELYPRIAEVFKEIHGIEPPKIEPMAFKTSAGVMRGGYFPARYDPVGSKLGRRQAAEAQASLYGGDAGRGSVVKSFTRSRAREYSDVVNLQWGIVPSHVAAVVHYVAFERFVRQTNRVLAAAPVERAVQRRLGLQYHPQLLAWVKANASFAADSIPQELEGLYRVLGWFRGRFVLSTLGYSLSVAAADFTNPLVPLASGEIKLRYLALALLDTMPVVRWPAARRAALVKSPELQHRAESRRRVLQDKLSEIGKRGAEQGTIGALADKIRDTAWFMMEWTDKLGATVIWRAAYRGALASGLPDSEAIAAADEVVQRNLPSHEPGQEPAILRDKRGFASLMVFYGYFSKIYNINHRLFAGMSVPEACARALAVIMVTNVLGEFLSGRGPEDDEEVPEWLMRKVLAAPLQTFPLVGSAAEEGANRLTSYLWQGEAKHRPFSMRGSPFASAAERLVRSIGKLLDKERESDQRFWDLIDAAGVLTGLPIFASQASRTGRYLTSEEGLAEDLTEGNLAKVASGLIYGERERQPANPLTLAE